MLFNNWQLIEMNIKIVYEVIGYEYVASTCNMLPHMIFSGIQNLI